MRSAEKLLAARRELASLEKGGSPEAPLEVSSASVIETRAQTFPCLRCDGEVRVLEHSAVAARHGETVRLVTVACRSCGEERPLYFRVAAPVLH